MPTTDFQNNRCLNNFTVGNGADGGVRVLRVENTFDTANSSAVAEAYVAGTTAADPHFRSVVGAAHSYAMGIDTSVARDWKLTYDASANATPSSALQIIDADLQGRILYPNQPMMKAHVSADVANVTGDNTAYTVIFDTVLYDRGANYNNATGIYTVPKTGVYLITSMVSFFGLTLDYVLGGAHINVDGTLICEPQSNPWANCHFDGAIYKNYFPLSTCHLCTAGQTIRVWLNIANSGAGGKFISVRGGMDQSMFTVNLLG